MSDTTGKCSACGEQVGIDTIHTCSPQVTAPKIVRKVNSKGHTVAMWLDRDGSVWGWGELEGYDHADKRIADHGADRGGWRISEETAADCGTTLAALRAELEGVRDE